MVAQTTDNVHKHTADRTKTGDSREKTSSKNKSLLVSAMKRTGQAGVFFKKGGGGSKQA